MVFMKCSWKYKHWITRYIYFLKNIKIYVYTYIQIFLCISIYVEMKGKLLFDIELMVILKGENEKDEREEISRV